MRHFFKYDNNNNKTNLLNTFIQAKSSSFAKNLKYKINICKNSRKYIYALVLTTINTINACKINIFQYCSFHLSLSAILSLVILVGVQILTDRESLPCSERKGDATTCAEK